MRATRFFLFLTFVLCCLESTAPTAFAAPVPLSPDYEDSRTDERKAGQTGLDQSSEVVEIAQPPPGRGVRVQQDYFFPYRRAFSLRFGQVYSSAKAGSPTGLVGVELMLTNEERESYEAGADLLTDGGGDLHLARRFIFTQSRLRPYAKIGAGILVNPADGLALLVNFSNYRAIASVGAELLVRRAESLRLDVEVAASTKAMHAIASLGYSWAW